MNEQLLQQLRQLLYRNGLDNDSSALLILLLLVLVHRRAAASDSSASSMDLSPLQLAEEVAALAQTRPDLQQVFTGQGLLKRLEPVSLTLAVDLARQLVDSAGGRIPAAALPALLDVGFACDPGLAMLVARLVNPHGGQQVYVPWDTTGQFSAALADLGAQIVIRAPAPSVAVQLIGMLYDDSWEIEQADPVFDHDTEIGLFSRGKFEAAASFPPMGLRVDLQRTNVLSPDVFPERTSSGAVLSIRQLLAATRGRIVVAVPNNVLFSSGAEYNLRMDLVMKGIVSAVIAMPGGLLSGTPIPFALLVLDSTGGQRKVRFINADTERFKKSVSRTRTALVNIGELVQMITGDLEGPEVRSVETKDLHDGQLQVHRHVVPEAVARARGLLDEMETVELDDIVTVIRPPLITVDRDEAQRELPPGTKLLSSLEVGAADLPRYGYITRPGRRVTLDPKARIGDQYLRTHDIVLITKGSVGKVGIVPAGVENEDFFYWLAGQSAVVLRIRDRSRLDPRALFVLLRSPLGQLLLDGIVAGSTIPMIQMKELKKLRVMIPDAEEQQRAIEILEQEARLEEEITELRAKQAQLTDGFWQVAIQD